MSRESHETIGSHETAFPSQRAEASYLFAETYDPKVSIDTIVQ
jgi:hypothetical protein